MKVEEKGDVGTICGGGGARPASVTNQVVVWSAHCLSVWHFVTPMPPRLGDGNTIFMVWPKYHSLAATQIKFKFIASYLECILT